MNCRIVLGLFQPGFQGIPTFFKRIAEIFFCLGVHTFFALFSLWAIVPSYMGYMGRESGQEAKAKGQKKTPPPSRGGEF